MPDKPDEKPPLASQVFGNEHAPFLYLDGATTFSYANGIVGVTIAAATYAHSAAAGEATMQGVAVAHLRMSVPAAEKLRDTIDRALLLAAQPRGSS
jgi:hypothetical protein